MFQKPGNKGFQHNWQNTTYYVISETVTNPTECEDGTYYRKVFQEFMAFLIHHIK
jgi:hypothetical protein